LHGLAPSFALPLSQEFFIRKQKRFCSFRNPKKKQMDNYLILERLDRLERLLIANKEVLTFEETCDYTGISRSYLYKLTASGNIPHSKPNGKMLFFERAKLNTWLLQNGRKSKSEIETEALNYTFNKKRR
tara:strand:+ start:5669 stop:6058 length:390 start_codon:yes stop_codon:yes gene_type:complete